jgi:hypothetical protein
MSKEITIIKTRNGEDSEIIGTVEYLVNSYFGYTLECGRSWEHEKGNYKINCNPKSAKSLVTNLNRAVTNSAANGCASTYFSLK